MGEKKWPENCVWPRPRWDISDRLSMLPKVPPDQLQKYLKEDYPRIKEYMDEQVSIGRLNPDYTLNKDYYKIYSRNCSFKTHEEAETLFLLKFEQEGHITWRPKIGSEFWDGRFLIEEYERIPADIESLYKIPVEDAENDPVGYLNKITGYRFQNENLLRQAFTRKAYKIENDLIGYSESFEFLGNAVLNAVVSKEIENQNMLNIPMYVDGAALSRLDKGGMTDLRTQYVNKEYLAERAVALGLDRFILYGKGEKKTKSSCGDIIEAIIGAVTFDSGWNWAVLEDVVFKLIDFCVPFFGHPNSDLDELNRWHQTYFSRTPEYKVSKNYKSDDEECFDCMIRFSIPKNDKGLDMVQEIIVKDESTRSLAKKRAAEKAVAFIKENGLWIDLRYAEIEPRLEDSINQLQELYQKKYIDKPVYSFSHFGKVWSCNCKVGSCNCDCFDISSEALSKNKTDAKKKASFKTLVGLLNSSGVKKEEWSLSVQNLKVEEEPLSSCVMDYIRNKTKNNHE